MSSDHFPVIVPNQKSAHAHSQDKAPAPGIMRTWGGELSVWRSIYLDLIGCQLGSVMEKEDLKIYKTRVFVYVGKKGRFCECRGMWDTEADFTFQEEGVEDSPHVNM